MLQLVYVSSAIELFSSHDLLALLEQSRAKNVRAGITGLLLYKDGNFMQLLEGPEAAVRELYAAIRRDARHHGIILLLEGTVEEREFPDWAMAFPDLTAPALLSLRGATASF